MTDTDAELLLQAVMVLLPKLKREHSHCDDSWYCCRACRHSDHGLYEGEHLGEGHDTKPFVTSFKPGDCTCGAAELNAKADDVLRMFDEVRRCG